MSANSSHILYHKRQEGTIPANIRKALFANQKKREQSERDARSDLINPFDACHDKDNTFRAKTLF